MVLLESRAEKCHFDGRWWWRRRTRRRIDQDGTADPVLVCVCGSFGCSHSIHGPSTAVVCPTPRCTHCPCTRASCLRILLCGDACAGCKLCSVASVAGTHVLGPFPYLFKRFVTAWLAYYLRLTEGHQLIIITSTKGVCCMQRQPATPPAQLGVCVLVLSPLFVVGVGVGVLHCR